MNRPCHSREFELVGLPNNAFSETVNLSFIIAAASVLKILVTIFVAAKTASAKHSCFSTATDAFELQCNAQPPVVVSSYVEFT